MSKNEAILRVEQSIEAIKNGEMIIIMDDEDRENEGDLVMAGIFSTPDKINFMAQYARGLICVSITEKIANDLDLPPMVASNSSNHNTAFTISIDAKEAKTGISAYERSLTIELMCRANAKPDDFVRPGHIFPLVAKEGGVLERTGHTEASIDICKLAGLKPVSVICEIMKEDGLMARRDDKFLIDFASKHSLKILYVSDLIEYRMQSENLVSIQSEESSSFFDFDVTKTSFKDHIGRIHIAYKFGDTSKIPYVKFHIVDEDILLLEDFSRFNELVKSIDILKEHVGYLVFLRTSKNSDIKELGIGAQILKLLGILDFKLISSTKNEDSFMVLNGFNLKIVEVIKP
ncbi:bifunctional 3,4-dihydroxy-2-butanone 4-phosphate synthase/GTP cyclohydrolase II [Helicobacter ibis]|uniref:3,4-dihydroxy-2-butanone 4-phosphate synthase n=1 Tax=Helicobacter ibis TaxID=2962633 RepID=A0ABT4VBQ7_9HELI|nr:bifunctional 3,4-dihydroxy-2-butanone 4-phosphate synthase/GTP cyclohydrolase II [Helicobacter ibis]MDA3968136.1 bifunctional 3,4-dihydroxy-2-butanone 4-phosphate synthase/GTP cyclohydrolase II [Helicobacter ibis]